MSEYGICGLRDSNELLMFHSVALEKINGQPQRWTEKEFFHNKNFSKIPSLCFLITERMFSALKRFDIFFILFPSYWKQQRQIQILKDYIKKVCQNKDTKFLKIVSKKKKFIADNRGEKDNNL